MSEFITQNILKEVESPSNHSTQGKKHFLLSIILLTNPFSYINYVENQAKYDNTAVNDHI